DRLEHSRNAKAQARHRAGQYSMHREQTATKLQTTLSFTSDQVVALPLPSAKIHKLEQEMRCSKQNFQISKV
ncbi:hypothetical protein BDR04DRAFT_948636, partial [Suillus decipiens]